MIVNRVWRWHFGQGLVRSVDNFGKLGRASLAPGAARLAGDPVHRRRLVAQDAAPANHALAGLSDEHGLERAGRADRSREPAALAHAAASDGSRGAARLAPGRERAARLDDGRDAARDRRRFRICPSRASSRNPALYQSTRRSVYLPVLRSALYDVFQAFDFPDPAVPNGDRATTTVASQALFMMNGPIVEQCLPSAWPRSCLSDASRTDRDRLQRACRRILGRPAAPDEIVGMGVVPRRAIKPRRRWPAKARNGADAWPGRDSAGPCCRPTSSSTSIDRCRSPREPIDDDSTPAVRAASARCPDGNGSAQLGAGFGGARPVGDAGRGVAGGRQPARAPAAALPAEGEAGHHAVHVRRPVAPGHVRSQAAARARQRPSACRPRSARACVSFPNRMGNLVGSPFRVPPARRERALDQLALPAPGASGPTTSA